MGGVSDRLGQISPKLVFFSLGYLYGGRWHDCRALAQEVLAQLPGTRRFSWREFFGMFRSRWQAL